MELKSLKHAKIRPNSKYIQVHAQINNVRYRFTTKKLVNVKNLLWVEQNYEILIEQHKQDKMLENVGADIATYGYEVLVSYCANCKESTWKRYNNVFQKYIVQRIGHYEVASVRPKHAREIYDKFSDLSHTNKSIVLNLLKNIFSNAVLDEIALTNPFAHLRNKAIRVVREERNKSFSMQDIKNILANCKNEILKLYCCIAFFTGMRTSEILALHTSDFDLQAGFIRVDKSLYEGKLTTTKTHISRNVEIIEPLKNILAYMLPKKEGYLFANDKGFMKYAAIRARFKKVLSSLNVENTLYATRHTFATIMLDKGEELQWVSKQLGHKDSSITLQRYVKYIHKNKSRGMFMNEVIDDVINENG